MQQLPLTFRYDGFDFRQITRSGRIALYGQYRGARLNSLEVVRIQTHAAYTWPNGTQTDAGEHYPSTRQWGVAGWTFKRLATAQAHMAALLRQEVA